MALQAAAIAETIAAMKSVIQGQQYSSESDCSTQMPTNRGHKLKRKAQFVREGQLHGEKSYKRKLEHAGYHRYLLSRNPQRYNEFGDELDPDELDDQADVNAAELNPYGDIIIERILGPLVSAAELPNHPSLSIPYMTTALKSMVDQACQIAQKEKKTLWEFKHLLTKFRGDESWVACEKIISQEDVLLFPTEPLPDELPFSSAQQNLVVNVPVLKEHTCGTHIISANATKDGEGSRMGKSSIDGVSFDSTSRMPEKTGNMLDENVKASNFQQLQTSTPPRQHRSWGTGIQETEARILSLTGTSSVEESAESLTESATKKENDNDRHDNIAFEHEVDLGDVIDVDGSVVSVLIGGKATGMIKSDVLQDALLDLQVPLRRMRTRAQAQVMSDKAVPDKAMSANTRSTSPDSALPPYIHPLYVTAKSAIPDRDFGLPTNEAEETRRILMMWVQKQEEVCRGAERLHEGLLKADRMRLEVLRWCKAEGHAAEMSDGEDWYDKDEWGLDDDLRKGQFEEEDDAANQGKKPRGRRTAQ